MTWLDSALICLLCRVPDNELYTQQAAECQHTSAWELVSPPLFPLEQRRARAGGREGVEGRILAVKPKGTHQHYRNTPVHPLFNFLSPFCAMAL